MRHLYHTPTPKAQGPSLEKGQKDSKGWRESMPATKTVFAGYSTVIKYMNSQRWVCMYETSTRPNIDIGGITEVRLLSEELLATFGCWGRGELFFFRDAVPEQLAILQ